MKNIRFIFCSLFALLFFAACNESVKDAQEGDIQVSSAIEAVVETAEDCINENNITYLCGPKNAEDIVRIGNSEWLLVSGMNGELSGTGLNGTLHLVNHEDKTYEVLFPGANPELAQNTEQFSACPGPIDASNISVHGLSIQTLDTASNQYRVYMTSHGAREAIEVFDLDASSKPVVKWVGCIPIPATSWTNSVTMLVDGGFYATQFMEVEGPGIADVLAEKITGHVFEWHPGEGVSVVAGTELSGPNGITISADERWLFVAAFGTREVVRFDTSVVPMSKEVVSLKIAPDNIRWSSDGTLFTAGNFAPGECTAPECEGGWGVYEIDPETMEANLIVEMNGSAALGDASSALLVGDEIWIGTYAGDRLGILSRD